MDAEAVVAYVRRGRDQLVASVKSLFATVDEDLLLLAFFRGSGLVRVPSIYAVREAERKADLSNRRRPCSDEVKPLEGDTALGSIEE